MTENPSPPLEPPRERAVTGLRTAWKPGQSGNPLGMQAPLRSLATFIRHQTGFGTEIASFYLEVMRGNPIRMPGRTIKKGKNGRKVSVLYIRPTLDQRIDAAAWLADRGWGKAKETIELTGEASPAQRLELLKRLSEDERAQLRGLLQRALEAQAPANSIPPIITTASTAHTQTDVSEPTTDDSSIP